MDEGQTMTNTEFDFFFGGKTHKVKKVNLRQVMDFQRKVAEIQKDKDPAADSRMAAYAIYIVLHSIDANITEDYILDNASGEIDLLETITKFGFMNQRKMGMMSRVSNLLGNKPSGEKSLEL